MRLAFCLFKVQPFGGLERDFLRVAKACLARGHEIHVYTLSWKGEIPKDFSVTFIPVSAMTNHGCAKQFSSKLLDFISKQKFDVVIGFNRLPGLNIYFAGDPCYRAEAFKKHSIFYRFLPRYRIYSALEKTVFSPPSETKILLLNPAHKQDFMDYYQTPASRFEVLFPGIGEDRKRPDNQAECRTLFRRNLNIHQDEKIILCVGSDFRRKGIDRALMALAALPVLLQNKTYLWIVGKGDVGAMSEMAKKLDITERVRFWGPREDIVHFYAAADVLLHPAYQETAGMVLIEAIAAGLPVLVTANCGYAPFIEKAQSGELISEPFSQSELNQKLLRLLSDESKNSLVDYRQHALSYANTHDLFQMTESIVRIIENAA